MDEQTRASRARFLGTVGAAGVAGAALAGGAWRTSAAGAAAAPRPFSAGHFALELDGASRETGFLRSVEGGNAVGEVVREVGSATHYQKKHIGNVRYEEFTAEVGTGMQTAAYDWISAFFNRDPVRRSGAIIAADFNYNVQARREFHDALITEVTFPKLDGSSKDAAFMTLKFAPDLTVDRLASGQLPAPAKQKPWLASNFKLEVGGLPSSRVNKIDAFTIKQASVGDDLGELRDFAREPGKLEVSDLAFTLPEADAGPWLDWFDDFVLQGNNGEGAEKSGELVYLAPDLKDVIARIELSNLGIFKLSTDKAEAANDKVKRIKVELYCESITFKYEGAAK